MHNAVAEEKDINDVFDDIFLSEEKLHQEGYNAGYTKGVAEGNTEAFHLGYHRGAEIGAELGYYHSITETYLRLSQEEQDNLRVAKHTRHLEKLKTQIEAFPKHNSEDVDILKLVDDIRTLFRKVCALLKIEASFPETDKLSF